MPVIDAHFFFYLQMLSLPLSTPSLYALSLSFQIGQHLHIWLGRSDANI